MREKFDGKASARRVVVGKAEIDDIDHLGNRRVRSVGELAEKSVAEQRF